MATAIPSNLTLIAQPVICAYPLSDVYAPMQRYLYYALLALVFFFPRQGWMAKIWLGAAAAYAATAAIHAFVIVGARSALPSPAQVTIPFIQYNSSTSLLPAVSRVNEVTVQPDALELDLDAITAIVVTACLVSLPLQTWSRTVRSSNVVRYMILAWNGIMLAATVCALVAWPNINTAPRQYRFCYDQFLDPPKQRNDADGWQSKYWQGSWNSTIWYIFSDPSSVWLEHSDNCFHPCFNTSQVLREPSWLFANVAAEGETPAKLYDPDRFGDDYFGALLYSAIMVVTGTQLYLVVVGRLGLCNSFVPIHEPQRLWRERRHILNSIGQAFANTFHVIVRSGRWLLHATRSQQRRVELADTEKLSLKDLLAPLRLLLDLTTIILLNASLTIFPITVIGFICWIEWYIRNDGSPSEHPQQVGQWSPYVSVVVVLIAGCLAQFRTRSASREELEQDIKRHEDEVGMLRRHLRVKYEEP